MRAILVSVIALITACAANPAWVERPARAASAKLTQPTKPLSSFAKYELKPMVISNAIVENAGKLKEAQELEQSLNEKILPLLESWHAGGSGLLLVETELISLRIVGRVTRFFLGGLTPGFSHMDLDLRLIDATTGEEIANVKIRRKATNAGAAFSGVGDQTVDDYVVAVVYDYLSENY